MLFASGGSTAIMRDLQRVMVNDYMARKQIKGIESFNWHLPVYGAIAAIIIFIPIVTYAFDVGELLYVFVAVPIISLILLVVAIVIACYRNWLRSLAIFSILIAYCAVSWLLHKNSIELHMRAHWLLNSKTYESQVLAQPVRTNGDFRHIEWDGWGWGSMDTSAYLVFDPSDSLSSALKSHANGKVNAALCGVSKIQHLQNHWYSVVFFTGTGWGQCN